MVTSPDENNKDGRDNLFILKSIVTKLESRKNEIGRYFLDPCATKTSPLGAGNAHIIDRNVILYLHILKTLLSHLKTNKQLSENKKVIYKEIVTILEAIDDNYNKLQGQQNITTFIFIKPKDLFLGLLFSPVINSKIFDCYIDLAYEYIDQLEIMTYAIINRLDEINFDIESYSADFFEAFFNLNHLVSENRNCVKG